MIVVLYGTDDFSIDEEAQRLAAEAMPPDMADLNTTRLAADASVDDVRAAATTAPFLAPHRVARVDGLLSRLTQPPRRASGTSAGRPRQRKNTATKRRRGRARRVPAHGAGGEPADLHRTHRCRPLQPPPVFPAFLRGPLGKALKEHATVKELPLPQGPGLVRWLRERARRLGGSIMPDAADLLAQVSDGDLRSLDQEVRKLLTYAGPGRAVNTEDVRLLVHAAAQTDVFAFVDALATGQQRQALTQLAQFYAQGAQPHFLVGMIARQVRLLNQAKALAQAGTSAAALPAGAGHASVCSPQGRRTGATLQRGGPGGDAPGRPRCGPQHQDRSGRPTACAGASDRAARRLRTTGRVRRAPKDPPRYLATVRGNADRAGRRLARRHLGLSHKIVEAEHQAGLTAGSRIAMNSALAGGTVKDADRHL